MTRMNPEIKARWVAALRSGEYKQTRSAMRRDGGHCCLAVLCAIHAAETGQDLWVLVDAAEGKFRYADDDNSYLPAIVMQWAGLRHCEGASVVIDGARGTLAEHNDGMLRESRRCRTFAEIADAIEEQL